MARNTSVVLSDHFQEFVEQQVESGRYASTSEVVRAGLRMLESYEERVARLGKAIEDGLASGEPVPFDLQEFLAEMHAKHRQ